MESLAERTHKAILNTEGRTGSNFYRINLIKNLTEDIYDSLLNSKNESHIIVHAIVENIRESTSSLLNSIAELPHYPTKPYQDKTFCKSFNGGYKSWECIMLYVGIAMLAAIVVDSVVMLVYRYRSLTSHLSLGMAVNARQSILLFFDVMEKNRATRNVCSFECPAVEASEEMAFEDDNSITLSRVNCRFSAGKRDVYIVGYHSILSVGLRELHTLLSVSSLAGSTAACIVYLGIDIFATTGRTWAKANIYLTVITLPTTLVLFGLSKALVNGLYKIYVAAHGSELARLSFKKTLKGKDVDSKFAVSGWYLYDSHTEDTKSFVYDRLKTWRERRIKRVEKLIDDVSKTLWNITGLYLFIVMLALLNIIWGNTQMKSFNPSQEERAVQNSIAATALLAWTTTIAFCVNIALQLLQLWYEMSQWMADVYSQTIGRRPGFSFYRSLCSLNFLFLNTGSWMKDTATKRATSLRNDNCPSLKDMLTCEIINPKPTQTSRRILIPPDQISSDTLQANNNTQMWDGKTTLDKINDIMNSANATEIFGTEGKKMLDKINDIVNSADTAGLFGMIDRLHANLKQQQGEQDGS